MGVYNTEFDDLQGFGCEGSNEKHCSDCGGPLHYPFLAWTGQPGIFLCLRCCATWRNGLIADLNHAAAIAELRKYYPGETLVRTSVARLQEEGRRDEEAARREMEADRIVPLKKGK